MHIEFRHGPKDGLKRFIPLGQLSDTILVDINNIDYCYQRTARIVVDCFHREHIVYQCLGIVSELPISVAA